MRRHATMSLAFLLSASSPSRPLPPGRKRRRSRPSGGCGRPPRRSATAAASAAPAVGPDGFSERPAPAPTTSPAMQAARPRAHRRLTAPPTPFVFATSRRGSTSSRIRFVAATRGSRSFPTPSCREARRALAPTSSSTTRCRTPSNSCGPFVIDGTVQYNRTDDTGALADQKTIPIFSGSVPPGDHTVQVLLGFQGNGYGVFTYLKGYHFEVKSGPLVYGVEGRRLPHGNRPREGWSDDAPRAASVESSGTRGGTARSRLPGRQPPDAAPRGTERRAVNGSVSVGGTNEDATARRARPRRAPRGGRGSMKVLAGASGSWHSSRPAEHATPYEHAVVTRSTWTATSDGASGGR